MPLLASPPTVTTTFPLVAPAGTGTAILVADHVVGVATTPLNVTLLVPCVAPKLVPVIVTAVPIGPLVGDKLVIVGGTVTVKGMPLLTSPPTVTTTFPVVAPTGTGTMMLVADHAVGAPIVPLKATVLVPFVAPKLLPVMVTTVPTGPLAGVRVVILGADVPVPGWAGLKAASAAPHQRGDAPTAAVADVVPAVACIRSSTIKRVEGAASLV